MLEVKNLSKQPIFSALNFELKRGEIAIFLGASGVGKSTLLRALSGLESVDEGSVILDGRTLLPENVGMVFQHFNLFDHLTVEENISIALLKVKKMNKVDAKKKVVELLYYYGLQDKAKVYPSALSGGQKQRLAIARSLALSPDLLCLDEPTSALDPLLSKQFAGYLEEIANDNRLVCLSTHDTGFVAQLNARLFLMQEGTIVESCKSSDLQNFPRLCSFLYTSQK